MEMQKQSDCLIMPPCIGVSMPNVGISHKRKKVFLMTTINKIDLFMIIPSKVEYFVIVIIKHKEALLRG